MKIKLTKAQLGLSGKPVVGEYNWMNINNQNIVNPLMQNPIAAMQTDPNQVKPLPQVQPGNSRPADQTFWEKPVTLNWNYILGSQLAQGALGAISNASPNSYQNAVLRFNNSYNPTSWLPQNPNTSNQAFYGIMQDGGIIDAYIRDFMFEDYNEPVGDNPLTKKKKETPDERVTETDVQDVGQEVSRTVRRSMDTINRLLGQTVPAPVNGYDNTITSTGKYGNQNIGEYGHQIINDLTQALGYSPTFNSIYRDRAQQDALIAAGKPAAKNSWHLSGNAVDMKPADWNKLSKAQQDQFRTNYDVVYHDNHYHIEPKGKKMQQGGQATMADSLALYNNALAVRRYYDNKRYVTAGEAPISGRRVHEENDKSADYFKSIKKTVRTENGYVNIKDEEYRKDLDKNKYLQRETANGILDLRAPMSLFDRRINPQTLSFYANKDSLDVMEGDRIALYTYDPIAVKPYNMLTPQEKAIRDKKYPQNGVIQRSYGLTPPGPKLDPRTKNTNIPIEAQETLSQTPDTFVGFQRPDLVQNKTNYSYTYPTGPYNEQNSVYFKNEEEWKSFIKEIATSSQSGKGWGTATGPGMQTGGIVNTTGYLPGSGTENNPMNIIPGGDITMQTVPIPVMAIPFKNNKAQKPVVMKPGKDYTFDADFTMEFAMGGEYEVTEEQAEMLKKLGYEFEIS